MSVTIQLDPDRAHLVALVGAVVALDDELARIERWGRELARLLAAGGRLLAVGNGGSAAQAQHLTSELVGRSRDDRPPFAAIALHADTSSLTAIANDFGAEEMFARQVHAHGRPGDVLVALSTSGESPNVLAAVEAAAAGGVRTWALTGSATSTLSRVVDEVVAVDARSTATIQEVHLVLIHLLCEAVDREVHGVEVVRLEETIE
jgi:D-sedoheptulose 7-phosphate isomerase